MTWRLKGGQRRGKDGKFGSGSSGAKPAATKAKVAKLKEAVKAKAKAKAAVKPADPARAKKIAALKERVKKAQASVDKTRAKQALAKGSMFTVPKGTKVHDALPNKSGTYTVRLAALKSATRPEGAAATNREVGIREGVARGVKFNAVKVSRDKNGKLEINDGNNRIAVARERGEAVVRVQLDHARQSKVARLKSALEKNAAARSEAATAGRKHSDSTILRKADALSDGSGGSSGADHSKASLAHMKKGLDSMDSDPSGARQATRESVRAAIPEARVAKGKEQGGTDAAGGTLRVGKTEEMDNAAGLYYRYDNRVLIASDVAKKASRAVTAASTGETEAMARVAPLESRANELHSRIGQLQQSGAKAGDRRLDAANRELDATYSRLGETQSEAHLASTLSQAATLTRSDAGFAQVKEHLAAVKTVHHEELHSMSRSSFESYKGAGAVLEEVGTELTAVRAVTRLTEGVSRNPEFAKALTEDSGYGRHIETVGRIVSAHSGKSGDAVTSMMRDAHIRSALNGGELFKSGADHVRAFVAALDVPDEARAPIAKKLGRLRL